MQIRQLEYFVAVAEHRNFTRAAESVFVAQSALSQQIRDLERELATPLFERTSRAVRLTPAGQALLPVAQRILADLREARAEVDAVGGLERGRLALGGTHSISATRLPELLAQFHRRHPGIEITVRDERPDGALASVLAGDVDLAFASLPPAGSPPGLASALVRREELVAIIGRGHPLASRERVELAELRSETFLDFRSSAELQALVDAACEEAGFQRQVAFRVGSIETLRRLVALDVGVAIVPESSVPPGTTLEVAVLRLQAPTPTRNVVLAWRKDGPANPAARAFLAEARVELGERPRQGEPGAAVRGD